MNYKDYLRKGIEFKSVKTDSKKDLSVELVNVLLHDSKEGYLKLKSHIKEEDNSRSIVHTKTFNGSYDFIHYWGFADISKFVRDKLNNGIDKVIVNFYGTSEINKEFQMEASMRHFVYDLTY